MTALAEPLPLLDADKRMHGADAERCSETGFVFERGSGALPKAQQTALFKQNLADPLWVEKYKANDPHARIRHPELFK